MLKPGDKCPLFKDGVVPDIPPSSETTKKKRKRKKHLKRRKIRDKKKKNALLRGESIPIRGEDIPLEREPNLIKKTVDWWDSLRVKPHVAFRDLNCGEGTKVPAVEIGIRFTF